GDKQYYSAKFLVCSEFRLILAITIVYTKITTCLTIEDKAAVLARYGYGHCRGGPAERFYKDKFRTSGARNGAGHCQTDYQITRGDGRRS
ncbi:hypothetical protein SAMN04488499_11071, partial [Sporomusa acidovorans]